MVKRSDFYRELFKTVDDTSADARKAAAASRSLADEVVKVKSISKIKPGLEAVVSDNITIDQLLDSKTKLTCDDKLRDE